MVSMICGVYSYATLSNTTLAAHARRGLPTAKHRAPRMRIISAVCKLYDGPIRLLADHDRYMYIHPLHK